MKADRTVDINIQLGYEGKPTSNGQPTAITPSGASDSANITLSGFAIPVTYDKNGQALTGTLPQNEVVANDGSYTISNNRFDVDENDYTLYWIASSDGKRHLPGETLTGITSALTLTASVEKNYKIEYNPYYTDVVGAPAWPDKSAGTLYTIPADFRNPTLEGYTFLGWELFSGRASLTGYNLTEIKSDVVLRAKWKQNAAEHTVNFLPGAADAYIPFLTPATVEDGANYQIPTAVPTREGYTFAGWSDGTTTYAAGDTIPNVTKDLLLTAQWVKKSAQITITNLGNTSGVTTFPASSFVKAIGDTVNLSVTVPAQYSAAKLLVNAGSTSGEHKYLAPSAQYENTDGSVILYYQFTATEAMTDNTNGQLTLPVLIGEPTVKTYNVTLPISDKVDVSFTDTTIADSKSTTVDYGSEVAFKVAARTGYTVKGVYANGQKLTEENGAYTIKDITADQTVTVDVEAIQFHKVTYVVLDKTYLVQDVQHGQTSTVEDPVVEGYEFLGWYTSQAGGTQADLTSITEDTIVYAHLSALTYTVMYDANNGAFETGAVTTQTKTHGKALSLNGPVPTREGYTFLGWSTVQTATSASYVNGDQYSNEGNVTLYAVWQQNTYTVTLPSGTGYSIETSQSTTVTHGDNFTFTVKVDRAYAANEPVVKVNEDTNALTYDTRTENADGSVSYTYTIMGIKENKVVSVQVKQNLVYTVTFMTGDSVYQTQQVGYGEKATRPVDPTVEGYTFGGWYQDAECTNAWNFVDVTDADGNVTTPANTVTGSTTIYAMLTPITPAITWPATAEQVGYELKFTTPDALVNPTGNTGTVAYNDKVTFTITVADGYDASKMQVGVNGILYSPTEKNSNVYTFEFTAKEDTKITVVGIERKTITITYNANARDDVSGLPTAEKVKYYLENAADNDTITTQIPSRTGYEFVGWCTDSEATVTVNGDTKTINAKTGGVVVYPGATATFTTDTTLYAIWLAQDTELTLKITDVALKVNDERVIQYEGESITLQATLNHFAVGSVTFYKSSTKEANKANSTIVGSTSIEGTTATFCTTVGEYKTTAKDEYYWAEFTPNADEGYSGSTSGVMNVGIFSKALSWKITEGTSNVADNGNVLNVYEGENATGTPITGNMIAGHTYTLEVKTASITGVETLDSKQPVLGKDYKIVWQYTEVGKNDWKTAAEASDKATYLVTGDKSGYQFRAQIVPLGPDNDSLFIKAGKFNGDTLVNDQYDTCLYTKSTNTTVKQTTATTLTITGAENEANNVFINGSKPFVTLPGFDSNGSHLAQFEGQTVTLTAKVTKDGGTGVETGKVEFYRLDGTDWKLIDTVNVETQGTNTGVASTTYTMGAYDNSNSKTATDNKETFKAVYVANETYATSETDGNADVYIKSAKLQTPIIESDLAGEGGKKATTYSEDLNGLLAGVQHEFTLRQDADQAKQDYSVVALDGRTVKSDYYDVKWLKTTGSNEQEVDATGTNPIKVDENKAGDRYRVKLTGKGVFANSEATSKDAVIGTKQDVTVTVKALDAIESTAATDVYQLNEIELKATVKAAETSATMQPTGTVTFYYKDGENWVKLDSTTLAAATDGSGSKIASIKTTKLPVTDTTNIKRDVEITAVYSGDATFNASATVNETEKSITAAAGCTTTNDTVTVYSSVVYAGDSENKATTQSTYGIAITADGAMASSESSVTLTLGQVYTLDHNIDLSMLTYGTDYTVQWQILRNAVQYQDTGTTGSYANTDKWEDLPNQTGSSYTGTMEQDAAYRAKITVTGTPITKGSFEAVKQTIPGRKDYYSNVLVVGSGMATVTTNITTSANKNFNEEGIVEGETATIHVIASGAAKTTPISHVTATITKQGATDAIFTDTTNNVNGYTSFAWDTKDVTPGYYTLTVKAESNNGYAPQTIERTLIVRDNDYALTATTTSKVYNGKAQGIDWTLTGVDIENALAQKSVVIYYYDKDGKMVEPTQAGEYSYKMYLPASAYWTELEPVTGTFIITQRPVEVVDLIAQAKVYDGTTNANIQDIILNDATVNETTGLPNTDTGIINGDSVYAIGTGYTSAAAAGAVKLGVKDVTLAGDDAANYTLSASSYTENFHIQRSQVKGAIISGATYQYTGKDIKLSANDIYLIDQAGNVLTNYTVTYYYHNGDGVEKVDAMNKLGKYTVIARPEQSNYKGGATATVYVGTADAAGTLDTSAVSTLITISNTAELYGAATGVTASTTNDTATTTIEYQSGSTGWTATAPTSAGRYLVKVTASTGDVAYGIYTITKARPVFVPTTSETETTYTSGRYDGTVAPGFEDGKSDNSAETYVTYTGGTIQGVAYEAPTEAGEYIATVHVGETANYTAHEEKVAFEIKPAELTIKADDLQRWQYGAYPDMVATYTGLATGGVAADTSLRDVQIQPEFIFNEAAGGYTNDALDHTGNYPITVRNALARNYTITYVSGNIATTAAEPKAELAIHGMPDNGGTTAPNLVYYGDTIQLYAYGYYKTLNGNQGSYNTSSLIKWSVNNASVAEIDQSGKLTIKGVGDFTVTLTRGSGTAAISTSINVKAEKQEVKVVVPNQDNVYSGTEQKYDGGKFYAETVKGEKITATPYQHDGKVSRTNVGSQIITAWVGDTNTIYQSEKYCGLFTINVKDVTVKPTAKETTYGTPASGLTYTEVTPATSDKVLTNGKAVSIADAYGNLDVYDGYEILVAGKENENYNVKYQTKNDAETVGVVSVTAKNLTVSTGTLNQQVGMTSGSLNPNGKYPVNGAEVASTASMGAANVRMYGEPNWVMDDTLDTLITGDSFADLSTLPEWLVKFDNSKLHDIAEVANTKYDAQSTLLSGKSNYSIDSNISVKNYNVSPLSKGTQDIYQRPVTLALREGLTHLNAYKPAIMPNGSIDKTALEELIRNNLVVGKYNDEGGLAELLKHTIKNLDLKFTYTTSGDTITVAVTVGNQNYYLANSPFTVTVKLDSTKIVADYGTLGWTSSTVTMYNVNEAGIKTTPTDVTGDVTYLIFTKDNTVADKYSNYKDKTPIRKVKMTKGASTGLYIANYDRLPAGEYVMFAIAEGYTIIE